MLSHFDCCQRVVTFHSGVTPAHNTTRGEKKELGSQAQEKNWNVQQCVSPFTIKASPRGGGVSVVIYDQDSALRLKFNT